MTRAKRPAFQFYPGDWLRDTALRSVSPAARGLWIDLMCLMHDGDPYGHLAVNGRRLPDLRALAMVGVPEGANLLRELEESGVLRRHLDGTIYSKRMVADHRLSAIRSEVGKLGAVASQQLTAIAPAKAADLPPLLVAAADVVGRDVVVQEGGTGETTAPSVAYLTACCVALNSALAARPDLGGAFSLVSAATQQGTVTWEADGIPLDTARRVITERTARFRITPRSRQPSSLRYFDAAVREAHEKATVPSVAPQGTSPTLKRAPRITA